MSSDPPPLPLTLHSSHLLIIYLAALPCSLLCVLPYSYMIVITMLAGWCLLGLEALIGEVGCVFGQSGGYIPGLLLGLSTDVVQRIIILYHSSPIRSWSSP